MRVSTNTSVLSLPCAGGSAAFHRGRAVSLIHTHLSGTRAMCMQLYALKDTSMPNTLSSKAHIYLMYTISAPFLFLSLCLSVLSDAVDPSLSIQPITEERASRTLYRVELLRQIREQVLRHPQLFERLALCQAGSDLPVWWETGTHDRDLLIGAAKHGVSRTDYHILRDPELSFMVAQRNYSQNKGTQAQSQAQNQALLVGQTRTPNSLAQTQTSGVPPSPLTNSTPREVTPKEELLLGGEEEAGAQSWPSLRPPTPTGDGLKEEKEETERRMEAARTKPLAPNPESRKQKKLSKRSRKEARRRSGSDTDSDASSSSSSSSSSSRSSSTSSTSSRSGSSSSSSSSSCSSGSSSSSSSSSSSEESDGEEASKNSEWFLKECFYSNQ